MGFRQLGVPFWGVLILIRIIVFWRSILGSAYSWKLPSVHMWIHERFYTGSLEKCSDSGSTCSRGEEKEGRSRRRIEDLVLNQLQNRSEPTPTLESLAHPVKRQFPFE